MGSQTPPRSFPPPPVLGEYGEPQVTLELPVADNRPHRYFVLPNGIEAIVISDELADKAAASITVEAGSMNDPEDLPGCAHFCWVTSQFVAAPIKTQELPLTGPDAVFRSFDLPFGPEELSKVVFYQSVQKNRTVSIFIPIPDVRHLYRTKLSNLKFKYSQKKHNAAYVGQLVKRLRRPVPRSKVLSSATVFGEYNSTLIETALEYLQVDKAIVLVESPELPVNGPLTLDTIEPYSRSQYTLDNLPKFVKLGDTVDPTLHLPSPNPFIPRTFDIPAGTVSAAPLLLSESVTSRLWYKKDTTFLLPKSSIRIKLKSPLVSVSPRGAALSLLFLELFAHAFSTEADDANLAGLSYATARVHDTLRFHLSGFTDKLGFFVARVISTLLNFEVDPATFANISDQLRQDLKNELFQPPYRVAFRKSFHALVENSWAHEEVLQELEITDVAVFRAELFARLHIETFVYGGISDDDAIELHSDVEKAISSAALTPSEKGGPPRSLLLPKGYEGTWELPHAHGEEPNNAVVYNLYTPTGVEDRRTRLLTAFVAKVAEAPFFSILRTQEQLGYAVFVHYTGEGSLACFKAYIQSDRETAFIESRITDFLDNTLGGILKDLTDDDFGKYVQGVVGELEERPPNPKEEEQRLWGAISDRYYAFDRRATDAALLRTITKDEVLDYYHRYIHSSSKERRKLVLYLRSQKTAPAEVKSGEKIGDFAAFKHGLVAAKRAAPVKPLAEYAKRSGGA
ncbi:metalloprotease [Vanrija albida]|uniref:Metalloprotease n=1 Tax=Vanrija albida TaxID=181172 RepID=A0ABR3QET4_9TREE